MAIAVVQSSSVTRTSFGSGNPTVSMTFNPAAGSTLVLVILSYHGTNGAISSVSVGGNAMTKDVERASGATSYVTIWRLSNWAGGIATATITPASASGHFITAQMHEVSGLDLAAPIGVTATGSGSGTPISIASGGVSVLPQIAFGAFAITAGYTNNGIATTAGTQLFAEQNSNTFCAGAAAHASILSSSGGTTAWSITTPAGWISALVTYKAPPESGAAFLPGITVNNEFSFTPAVTESIGEASAGAVPKLGPTGKLDPSTFNAAVPAGAENQLQMRSGSTLAAAPILYDPGEPHLQIAQSEVVLGNLGDADFNMAFRRTGGAFNARAGMFAATYSTDGASVSLYVRDQAFNAYELSFKTGDAQPFYSGNAMLHEGNTKTVQGQTLLGPGDLAVIHVGDTPPAGPVLNQLWADTSA